MTAAPGERISIDLEWYRAALRVLAEAEGTSEALALLPERVVVESDFGGRHTKPAHLDGFTVSVLDGARRRLATHLARLRELEEAGR